MLMATCCEDDIIPHVLPFVKDNIKSADWKYRDAAVMAFGNGSLPINTLDVGLFSHLKLIYTYWVGDEKS